LGGRKNSPTFLKTNKHDQVNTTHSPGCRCHPVLLPYQNRRDGKQYIARRGQAIASGKVTPVGNPDGSIELKIIGSNGGIFTTADGRLTITIHTVYKPTRYKTQGS